MNSTSRPTKGEVLMENDILTVGSSTLIAGNGFPVFLSAIVSPIYTWNKEIFVTRSKSNRVRTDWEYGYITWISDIPETAHMSPASTRSTGTLKNFSYTKSSLTLANLHDSSLVHT